MSKIDKLSISGIRSFSPASREAISFNTPLTLIVGYNGSGKTTVIECLKYATMGEPPPNSKGGAFIHDPKLCGEQEVLAQIKLQFRSINDRQHVATRSLQLTTKKAVRSSKTLDCSLVVVNNGERTTTSTRVAQLDEMIPERLGVSPAILDAVIFCHQDESLWPLSEPSALKKRFDEIFEALKYTKAIENLKVLRKKQGAELAVLENDEAHNKVNKDRGEKAEKRMTAIQAEIERARTKCESLTAEMEETQDKIRSKHEQANSHLQIVQNLNNKREQLEYRKDAVKELRQTLDELPEDDAALQRSLVQYEESMARQRDEAERNKTQYGELQGQLAEHRQRQSAKLADQGKHQSDKDKYERQIQSRMDLVNEVARQHGFRGFEGNLTDQQIQAFHERIQKSLNEKKRDLERLQRENAAELDKATGAITELEGRKAARTQDRVSAKQRMGAIETRTSILQNEAGLIDADEGSKAILDGQFKDLEGRLERAQQDFEKLNWDQQLSEANDRQWQLESENEKLNRELMECTRLASERAQLDFRKKELADRKLKLEALTQTWNPELTAVLEEEWQPDTLESQFQAALARQSRAVQDAQRKTEQARQKQQEAQYRVKKAKELHESKSQELRHSREEIIFALHQVDPGATSSIGDYARVVSEKEDKVEVLKQDISLFDELVKYYESCNKTLTSKKSCHLCKRHFDKSQEAEYRRLKGKIEKKLDPGEKNKLVNELSEAAASLDLLRNVRSSHDTYERLSPELSVLRKECDDAETDHDKLDRELEAHESSLASENDKQKTLEDLSKIAASITTTLKDIHDAEAQVDRVMSQQSLGVPLRSAEEVHEAQAGVSEQLRALKHKISKLTTDRQRMKDQMSALELEKSEMRNRISRASGQLEKKKGLLTQIQTLKDDHLHQREIIQRADEELEKIEPSTREARSVRDEILRRGRSKEQTVADERDAIANSVNEIKMVDGDIQSYVDRGGPSNLAANQRAIASLEQTIAAAEQEIADLTVRANRLRQDIDSGDRKKKNINDNINYRRHLRMLESLRQDIAELESRHADEDYSRLQAEARSLENHANRLVAERGSVMGSMKTRDEELDRLMREWELDYKDAKRKYRESHIRVETTKAAIEDLAQCGSAVDKAVMQFHAMKMADVNRIAGELWQSTYQGTDIDTILIRSDAESKQGNRTYNYRLCMVKQDTEMDMRGRCSAGQKVLASIVIRLALAESFGVNCGLIALDEPTTNLDRDNIKSLAESLHRIIKARQQQSNFQLIVITHDEDFLRHMQCSDFCDSFYRVKRDERQNSVITRESITKIF